MQPTTFPLPVRAYLFGLDATPTGTDPAFVVVADFTGASETLQGGGILAGADAFDVVHSQTEGTRIKIRQRGEYIVRAEVQAQAIGEVVAGLNFDGAAGDFTINPQYSSRTRSRGAANLAAATDLQMISLSAPLIVTQDMAGNAAAGIVRLLLSDGAGAGAAAANLELASVMLEIERIRDVPG